MIITTSVPPRRLRSGIDSSPKSNRRTLRTAATIGPDNRHRCQSRQDPRRRLRHGGVRVRRIARAQGRRRGTLGRRQGALGRRQRTLGRRQRGDKPRWSNDLRQFSSAGCHCWLVPILSGILKGWKGAAGFGAQRGFAWTWGEMDWPVPKRARTSSAQAAALAESRRRRQLKGVLVRVDSRVAWIPLIPVQ
jgi:hypothetical protein